MHRVCHARAVRSLRADAAVFGALVDAGVTRWLWVSWIRIRG